MSQKIRNIVRQIIEEALETAHYTERVAGRLKSMYTYPQFNYSTISDSIDIIRKTNFPEQYSYAIKVKEFPNTEETMYNFVDPLTNKESVGNVVWAIIRNNKITSIMFRKSSQGKFAKTPVDAYLDISLIKKNYDFHASEGFVNDKGEVDFTFGNMTTKPRMN